MPINLQNMKHNYVAFININNLYSCNLNNNKIGINDKLYISDYILNLSLNSV